MNRTTHFRDYAKCRQEVPEPLVCDGGTKSAAGEVSVSILSKSREQSENVYENKGSPVYRGVVAGRPAATTPNPSLPRRGITPLTAER